ncbi:zf-CCHC domain-containing protein, partial [Tanacetum coccineum]
SKKPKQQVDADVIVKRLTRLEKKVEAILKIDHSEAINKSGQAHLKKVLSIAAPDFGKLKQDKAAKQSTPKCTTKPFDEASLNEYDQKNKLMKLMMNSKSYNTHQAHKALYDALPASLLIDKDDMDNQKRKDYDASPSKKSKDKEVSSKEAKAPSKSSKTDKVVDAEEMVIFFKEEIAKYAFEMTKSQVPCVRSPSLLQDHLAVVYSCEYHKYEEFTITDDETINCTFSRFNIIITSLKALDESFLSHNHDRKFLRALPSKWRLKVTAIEESKDLSKLSLDELVGNLKVYEVVHEKDLEIAKNKKEKYKSLALKARQVLSDEDASSSDNNDEEYAMVEDKKEDRRCFKCSDPNHFISDCPKNSFGDQKAFVVGSWSNSRDESKKEEICLMAHSNEVLSDTLYYVSSIDNESRENEYDKLCQSSLRIINKNKHLKTKNESLKRNVSELKTKIDILEKGKEISNKCDVCDKLKMEIESLKLKLVSFENSSSSLRKMVEMQKPSKDKCGLGYTEDIDSCSNNKIKKLGSQIFKKPTVEPAVPVPFPTEPASSCEQHRPSDGTAKNGKELGSNIIKKNDSVLITKKSILGTPKRNKQPPILKLGQGHGKSRI